MESPGSLSKHPNKDNVWLYRGGTEDLIVTSPSETFLPKSMEGVIESHLFVNMVLIWDRGETVLALLVQHQAAFTCEEQKQKFLDDIWPSVQSANEICPVEQRIQKGLMTITGPMPRAAKGYPRRTMMYEQFEKVIDGLYRTENLRLKARKDANLKVEADAQTAENWNANFDLKGATTLRFASQNSFI